VPFHILDSNLTSTLPPGLMFDNVQGIDMHIAVPFAQSCKMENTEKYSDFPSH
jgi:hypothetical protein